MASRLPVYEHLTKAVLELDDSEIKVITALRYKQITKLMTLDQNELDFNLKNNKDFESSTYNTLRRWMIYCVVNETTIEDVRRMDNIV